MRQMLPSKDSMTGKMSTCFRSAPVRMRLDSPAVPARAPSRKRLAAELTRRQLAAERSLRPLVAEHPRRRLGVERKRKRLAAELWLKPLAAESNRTRMRPTRLRTLRLG